MTMIDLGEVTNEVAGPAIPLNYRRILRVVLAVLAVAGVLVVAGSSPVAPPGLRPLWSTEFHPDDMMALDPNTAYVSRLGDDGRPGIAAYDLATGRKRWSVPTGDGGADFAARRPAIWCCCRSIPCWSSTPTRTATSTTTRPSAPRSR